MAPKRGTIGFPSWTLTVGIMLDQRAEVRAMCTVCSAWAQVDLRKLVAAKGREYSLVNRRCRCKLTEGCAGWNRFMYLLGVYRRLWDDRTAERWSAGERVLKD